MKKRTTEYHFAGLAALLLFGVFAICVALVLVCSVLVGLILLSVMLPLMRITSMIG